MSTTILEKPEFKVPLDTPKVVRTTAAAVQPAALIGTWSNCDHATRGLLKLVIAASGTGITVHAFGNCTPTPCDWGTVAGIVHATDVSSAAGIAFRATYKFAFKETVVTGVLDRGALVVETFDRFTDASGRSNYYSKYYFGK